MIFPNHSEKLILGHKMSTKHTSQDAFGEVGFFSAAIRVRPKKAKGPARHEDGTNYRCRIFRSQLTFVSVTYISL